ncbi:MAG: TonB-dependent receptor [Bacteroidetes bacterium]|nr:TonB-dependent receptor [Bacteroidota bacterium]
MRSNSTVFILFIAIFLISSTAFGQGYGVVSGTVMDTTGTPKEGVKVAVSNTKLFSVTRGDGKYYLQVPVLKSNEIIITYGKNFSKKFEVKPLKKDEIFVLNIKEDFTYEVGTVDFTYHKENLMMVSVSPKIFEFAPDPTGGGVEFFIKHLAGVSSNNELSSQYSVRGGNYDENLVYINDIEIYRPQLVRSGQQEGLSIIHPDMVSGLQFSAGGFEAKYGDKLSSVLDIYYKEPDTFHAKVYGSLLGAGATLEGASENHRLTYLIGTRYRTNQYLLNALDVKGQYRPSFLDAQLYVTYDLRDNLEVSLFSYYGMNKYLSIPQSQSTSFGTVNQSFRLDIEFAGQEIVEYNGLVNGLTLKYKPTKAATYKWINSVYNNDERESFDVIGSYTLGQLENDLGNQNFGKLKNLIGAGAYLNHARNKLSSTIYSSEFKGEYAPENNMINLQYGLKFQHENISDKLSEYRYIDSVDYSVPHRDLDTGHHPLKVYEYIYSQNTQSWNRYSAYIQNAWSIAPEYNATLIAGIRGNYWDYSKEFIYSPRIQFYFEPNLKYNRGLVNMNLPDSSLAKLARKNYRIKLATGFYHQPPFYRELRSLNGTLNPEIRAQKSYQIVGGSDVNFKFWDRPFRFSAEAYYKYLWDIIPYEIDNVRIRYYAKNNAVGYATGMDLQLNGELVKDNPSWISLSYLKTQEDIKDDIKIKYNYKTGNTETTYPRYIPRPTDQRIRFALFFQDYLPKHPSYKAHLSLIFGSGLPFGPPDYNRYKDTLRMPPYRRVDIGFSKLLFDREKQQTKYKSLKNFRSIWASAEIFNLFNIDNTISYIWIQDVAGNHWGVPNYLTSRRLNIHLEMKF